MKFRPGLSFVLPLLLASSSLAGATAPPQFVIAWGTFGSLPGQFKSPHGVATDGGGRVYVVEFGNNRVQKFTNNGDFLAMWGSAGGGPGQFRNPTAIAVDGSDNVFVADSGNHRVQKFDSGGSYLLEWGTLGTDEGQFGTMGGIAVDADGFVYVTDYSNILGPDQRVQKFTSNGEYVTRIGSGGTAPGQFRSPTGLGFDGDGMLIVADTFNTRMQCWTSSGTYRALWTESCNYFLTPQGVGTARTGGVYTTITQTGFNCPHLLKFDGYAGEQEFAWGLAGSGPGEVMTPLGIAEDAQRNVFVADTGNHRIQKFEPVPVPIPVQMETWSAVKSRFQN